MNRRGFKSSDKAQGAKLVGLSKESGNHSFMERLAQVKLPDPILNPLIYEGEVSLLFAFAGTGKSLLSFQIARSLALGERIFGLETVGPRRVLYLDTEMTIQQLKHRYDGVHFPDDMFKWESIRDLDTGEAYDRILQYVGKYKPHFLIIDNISSIGGMDADPKVIIQILKLIRTIRDKYQLTVLIVGHTPKQQLGKPITASSFYGTSALMNFVDSSFALGTSKTGKEYRYIIQVKTRVTEAVYDSESVLELHLDKGQSDGMLKFIQQREVPEKDILQKGSSNSVPNPKKVQAIEMREQGKSWNEISTELETPRDTVRGWAKDVPKGTAPKRLEVKDFFNRITED